MKKLIAIILGSAVLFSLTACNKNTDTKTETTTETEESQTVSIASPITELSSLEELESKTGGHFSTPGVMGVTDEAYLLINCGDYTIGSYKYTVNDKKCEIRFSDNLKDDISGYYLENGTAFESSVGEDEVITDEAALARWFTVDGQYVYILEAESIDKDLFESIVSDAKNASLGENSVTALSDFYSSICGEYADSVSQRAYLTVSYSGNKTEFVVSWSNSAFETVKWVMHIVKTEDGLLNYSDCTKTISNGDGETTEYKNGEGYFEYSEGKLLWTGAAEENCQSCVFEIMAEE